MNKITKNKKISISIILGVALISLIIGGIFLFSKNKEEKAQNNEIINNYVAYISINPLIKLEYTQTCSTKKCDDPIVIKYELVNDDAKNIYKDIDLIGTNRNLYDVITLISKTADENNIEFENVEIYSNWDNLNNYIESSDKGNYEWSYIINIRDKENLEIISSTLEENKVLYNIEFDTNGGNEIITQTVEKGKLATQPTTPIKNGYKFIEWQLNGEKFDFNQEINSDIKLIAKWEKIETTTDYDNSNNISNNNNSQDTDTNNNDSQKPNTNPDNNDNEDLSKKYDINLNDNVQYYISSMVCSEYVYVNPVCNNKSLNELKSIFPNYDKDLDALVLDNKNYFETDIEYQEWLNEYMNRKLTVGKWSDYGDWRYFPNCDDAAIPNNYLTELRKIQGMYVGNQSGPRFKFDYINFKDNKYSKFQTNLDYSKYGLVTDGGCGDDGFSNPNYHILDETTCTKFNLSCGRW